MRNWTTTLALALVLASAGSACITVEVQEPAGVATGVQEQAEDPVCERMRDTRDNLHDETWDGFDELNDALANLDPEAIESAYRSAGPSLARYDEHVGRYLAECGDSMEQSLVDLHQDMVTHAHETWGRLKERCDEAPQVFGRTLCHG